MLDDPEPVAQSEVMRVDICAEITIARQCAKLQENGLKSL